MMLHRHFEEDKRIVEPTSSNDLNGSFDTTDLNDPLYVPVETEEKPRRGRPRRADNDEPGKAEAADG